MPAIAPPPRKEVDGAYLPKGWDVGWKAAKAADLARLVILGDSTSAGQPGDVNHDSNATNPQDWWTQSYPGQLATLLAGRFPSGLGATFYGLNESVLRNPDYHYGGGAAIGSPLEFNDGSGRLGSGHNFNWSYINDGWWWGAGSADVTDWTDSGTWMARHTPVETDAVRVQLLSTNYFGNSAGTFYYDTQADGTTKTLVNSPKVGSGGYDVQRTTVWQGAAARPTVYLGKQGHASDLVPLGFVVQRNISGPGGVSKGLSIARHAFTGRTAVELSKQDGTFPNDRIKALVGGFGGSTYDTIGFPTCPHLLIFALGINDCNKSLGGLQAGWNGAPSTYGNVVRRVAEAGRRARPDMSILILVPWYPVQDYGDATAFSNNDSWPKYHAAARVVAEEHGCALLSVNRRWGSTSVARGFTLSDDGHPVAAGYADQAAFLASVL